MNKIVNRHEFIFDYDIKYANPNGDPLDSNKPRMDLKISRVIVTDVRLKRNIRDYFLEMGETVFVNGDAVTLNKRLEQILGSLSEYKNKSEEFQKDLLEKCIDIRLFGGTVTVKDAKKLPFSLTGPVQIRYGTSTHEVDPVFIQGTAAFASKQEADQRTFREEWIIPYANIIFHGIINQNAAKHTNLSTEDIDKFFTAMWNGTRDLLTRSKSEHLPRLLLDVVYKENQNFHIGELDRSLKINSGIKGEDIRDISQYSLNVSTLKSILEKYEDKIHEIRYMKDERLILTYDDSVFNIDNLLEGKTIPMKI